jgi:hypothetical protein
MPTTNPSSFFADATPAVLNGNSMWAQAYWRELKGVAVNYANRLPRNVQRHLGPSELGHECDRLLVAKMSGHKVHSDNHVSDPWASMVGTAIHAFLEQAFDWDNKEHLVERAYRERWKTETRVCPDPSALQSHPGTADLYDSDTFSLVDHKCQGEGPRDKLRRHGPPQHYYIQMLLYAIGYMYLGQRVDRVVLVSWPRTKSSLEEGYVWEHIITAEDFELIKDVLAKTEVREAVAVEVNEGRMSIWDVPMTPSYEDCFYCPLFRPQAASDPTVVGCPGTAVKG